MYTHTHILSLSLSLTCYCCCYIELEAKNKKAKKSPNETKQEIAKKKMEFEASQKRATEEFLKKQGKSSFPFLRLLRYRG
jgi:hypothetical protein